MVICPDLSDLGFILSINKMDGDFKQWYTVQVIATIADDRGNGDTFFGASVMMQLNRQGC